MEENGKSITKLISKEKTIIQNLLKSLENIEKIQHGPVTLNELNKIKQEIVKVGKDLEKSKLDNSLKKDINQRIEDIKSKIPQWEQGVRNIFGQKLENELNKMNFELKGHYPLLKVSFYTLEVDSDNFKVLIWYGPQQEKLEKCKLVPEEVVGKLKTMHDKIMQRHFSGEEFLSKVYEAYKIFICCQDKRIGDPIPITDILFGYAFLIQDKKFRTNPTKDNFKEYGRVLFSYDLYRLKERIIYGKELSLVTATRAYTRRESDFLWVPTNDKGDGSYISHIKFREAKHE